MNLSAIRGVIFDFDGTLAPNLDLPLLRQRVVDLTRAEGVPEAEFRDRFIIEIIDAGTGWLRQQDATAARDYHKRAHNLITSFELDAAAAVDPFPEVRGLLRDLRRRQVGTAVVTRNCEQAVRNTFPDIDEHLDILLARDNVDHYKPDPRHLEVALARLATRPDQAMMVGDGRMDMQLGKGLDLVCVGVLTGSSSAAELKAAGADLVIDHIRDLGTLFTPR